MAYDHIRFVTEGGVATLSIARPEVRNALSSTTVAEMIDAIDRVAPSGARALLLRGDGGAFCSGADLGADWGDDASADRGKGLETAFNPLVESLARLPVPFIAAVSGAAAGGGCALALAADIVIAARSAYFLQPFVHIGLIPDMGSSWLLPRLAGKARASAMMLLGDRIPAESALDWGLIYQVVEDGELETTAAALARRLAAGPTIAYSLTRRLIAEGMSLTLSETLVLERENQRLAGQTADHAEGIAAFMEKRKPMFTGR